VTETLSQNLEHRNDHAMHHLARTTAASRLIPRRWLLFGSRRYSGKAAAEAFRYAKTVGRGDGQHPNFDIFSDPPRLPNRAHVVELTNATQETLGHDAAHVRKTELRRISKARANANTGTVKHYGILLVALLVGLFEYVVGVHVANLVYQLREQESQLIAVILAVLASLVSWSIASAIREQRREAAKRKVSILLAVLIAVFIISLGVVLATRGGSQFVTALVTGGTYAQTADNGADMSVWLVLPRHLLYPTALAMGAGLIFLMEIIARQNDAQRYRREDAKSHRLVLRLAQTMTKSAARITGILQLSRAVEEAGRQVLKSYDGGVSEKLSLDLKDTLGTDQPQQSQEPPAWREDMENLAMALRDEAATLDRSSFPNEVHAS
jgi:hypothetical protein